MTTLKNMRIKLGKLGEEIRKGKDRIDGCNFRIRCNGIHSEEAADALIERKKVEIELEETEKEAIRLLKVIKAVEG